MFDGEAAAAAEWVNEFEIYINYKLKKIYLWSLCLWHRLNINVVVVIAIAGLMYWMTEYNHENHARIRLWLFINLTKCVYNYIINILSKFHISKTFRFIYDFEFPFLSERRKIRETTKRSSILLLDALLPLVWLPLIMSESDVHTDMYITLIYWHVCLIFCAKVFHLSHFIFIHSLTQSHRNSFPFNRRFCHNSKRLLLVRSLPSTSTLNLSACMLKYHYDNNVDFKEKCLL